MLNRRYVSRSIYLKYEGKHKGAYLINQYDTTQIASDCECQILFLIKIFRLTSRFKVHKKKKKVNDNHSTHKLSIDSLTKFFTNIIYRLNMSYDLTSFLWFHSVFPQPFPFTLIFSANSCIPHN